MTELKGGIPVETWERLERVEERIDQLLRRLHTLEECLAGALVRRERGHGLQSPPRSSDDPGMRRIPIR